MEDTVGAIMDKTILIALAKKAADRLGSKGSSKSDSSSSDDNYDSELGKSFVEAVNDGDGDEFMKLLNKWYKDCQDSEGSDSSDDPGMDG